nr:hypothetical protein [Fodinicola feengrottensis]
MAIPYSTDPVQNELFEIRSAITDLNALVAREQERASFREELIDRLHGENQTLRRSELDTTLEPVRGGLYRLYDLSSREAARWQLASTEGQPQSADQPPTQDGPAVRGLRRAGRRAVHRLRRGSARSARPDRRGGLRGEGRRALRREHAPAGGDCPGGPPELGRRGRTNGVRWVRTG